MDSDRGEWRSRTGFVLAAAGSAVGLGNIWKFPYITGQNGGAAFLIVYLVLVFTIGISIMLAELAIGRAARRNPVGAFARLKGGKWTMVGYAGVACAFLILPFYSVVGGWTIAYIVKVAGGLAGGGDIDSLASAFRTFTADPFEPLVYLALFMALTIAVVAGGVRHGIERWCILLFPALMAIMLLLVVRALTLPGAGKGVTFFLAPDFAKITPAVFHAALSQAFFSLALGMGAMITYGSYLTPRHSLPWAAGWVTALDTGIAILAGLAILPAVFAFGFNPAEGPGLTFITLPAVFSRMPGGTLFGVLFFLLLALAALTSALSLLEVAVAYFVDEKGMKRRTAAVGLGFVMFVLGIPASLSLGLWSGATVWDKTIFDLMQYAALNVLLPLGGICISLFVGWVIWPRALAEISTAAGHVPVWAPAWRVICRYIAPAVIAWILFGGL